MDVYPEWKRQKLQKKHVKKLKNCFTHYDAKHFSFFFKEIIRIDLKEESISVYDQFGLTTYVILILLFNFVCLLN